MPASDEKTNPIPLSDYTAADVDVLARTIYGEARGEPDEGQIAVAWVVRNRVEAARRSPRLARIYCGRGRPQTVSSVCHEPWSFSCWNENDPNCFKIKAVAADTSLTFTACLSIAQAVLEGVLADPTAGATFYFDRRMPTPPEWAEGREPCARIGHHTFYSNIEEA